MFFTHFRLNIIHEYIIITIIAKDIKREAVEVGWGEKKQRRCWCIVRLAERVIPWVCLVCYHGVEKMPKEMMVLEGKGCSRELQMVTPLNIAPLWSNLSLLPSKIMGQHRSGLVLQAAA